MKSTALILAGEQSLTIPDMHLFGPYRTAGALEWPSPLAPQVFRLTPTEKATIRITPPARDQIVYGHASLSEASVRLCLFGEQGLLPWASAHYIAQQFEYVFHSIHPRNQKYAKKGWLLLGSLAEYDLVQMAIAAEPLLGSRDFRRMPLRQRLAELELS